MAFWPIHTILRRLEEIETQVARTASIATGARHAVDALAAQVASLEDSLNERIDEMSDAVQSDLDAIKGGVATLQTGITALEQQIAALLAAAQAGAAVTPEQLAELHQDALDVQQAVASLPQAPSG